MTNFIPAPSSTRHITLILFGHLLLNGCFAAGIHFRLYFLLFHPFTLSLFALISTMLFYWTRKTLKSLPTSSESLLLRILYWFWIFSSLGFCLILYFNILPVFLGSILAAIFDIFSINIQSFTTELENAMLILPKTFSWLCIVFYSVCLVVHAFFKSRQIDS